MQEPCTCLPSNDGFKIIFPAKGIIYDLVQAGQQGALCHLAGGNVFPSQVIELPNRIEIEKTENSIVTSSSSVYIDYST